MMNAIKPGFLSESEEVVAWTCKVMAKVAQEFADMGGELAGQGWEWFIEEGTGCPLENCL